MDKNKEITLEQLLRGNYNLKGEAVDGVCVFHSYTNQRGIVVKEIKEDVYEIIKSYKLEVNYGTAKNVFSEKKNIVYK